LARIHPTAVVDPAAKLADDAEVGPYAVIGGEVELAAGVVLGPHVVLAGRSAVGARTRIGPFCVIGAEAQLRGGAGGGGLSIGADNVIREFAALHAGSSAGDGWTRIGDGNLILHGAHVGHDCRIGSHCEIGSQVALAGHVQVEDHAALGAQVGVQQHVRVGESAFVGAAVKLRQDAPPFARVLGRRPRFAGINSVGLARRGVTPARVALLRHAYHLLFQSRLRLVPAVERVRRECGGSPEVERVLRFLAESRRGIAR
jgi:UDP-N-acetylglucosamine acyltransferase